MIYIIEGPDGSGKTTLAKQIQESNPGSEIVHFGNPQTDEEAYNYWCTYAKALRAAKDHTLILDRCWYSDQVYGPVLRHRLEMTDDNFFFLEDLVRLLGGGIVIYCTGTRKVMWRRAQARGEKLVTSDDYNAICEKYDEVMKKATLPVVRYNTTVPI